jgi:hypothetical protein
MPKQFHSGHLFYIPVMGTGFTIDTPLRVARFGISSVVSLVDDLLIERIHRYHAQQEGEPYVAIDSRQPDPRAARITAYLNFLNKVVRKQIETMKSAPFEAGSETSRYFELLPDGVLKRRYQEMLHAADPGEKQRLQGMLRDAIQPGSINVNIMTKLDAVRYRRGAPLPPEFSDAIAALRGYAQSDLDSAIVFSAGMNQRLYAYASEFPDFLPDAEGRLKKRIILKVSDFRSASIQGRYLAKRGLWISEFRIESGLNCGGHAFPCGGQLMGPILEEFKQKRHELAESLWKTCAEFWQGKGIPVPAPALPIGVTVQGGIGTAAEHDMLLTHYGVDATGWATPFLLAPDVTAVDDDLLERLITCGPGDVYLSDSSPIGVPFWNLRTSPSEEARRKRLDEGNPGSPCPKGFLRFDKSFTEAPLCLASQEYQQQQLSALREKGAQVTPEEVDHVTGKSCICHELGGSALRKYGIDANVSPAVCPGPNIVYFRRRTNLREMVDHIYGRLSLIDENARPHMFVNELEVNIDYLKRWIVPAANKGGPPAQKNFREFGQNLHAGIEYYQEKIAQFAPRHPDRFLEQLKSLEAELHHVMVQEKFHRYPDSSVAS